MLQTTRTPDIQGKIAELRSKSQPLPEFADDAPRRPRPRPAGRARLAVAIPSANRPGILPDTVRALALQDRLPDRVILSLAATEDMGDLAPGTLPFPVEIVVGKRGATAQRNQIISVLHPAEIVLMLDDDFLMAPDYLCRMMDAFEQHPDIVLATGTVLADGIHGPGYSHQRGRQLLSDLVTAPADETIETAVSGYGCNFALRASVVLERGLRFDETLPLYSWLEDFDFSRRIAPYGRLVKLGGARGVHLGTKTGRTPGVLLGYSQIANPVYLWRKGSMTWRHALKMMMRNTVSNLVHSIRPPHWADFRGRLRGNMLAVADAVRGRVAPGRVLELKT